MPTSVGMTRRRGRRGWGGIGDQRQMHGARMQRRIKQNKELSLQRDFKGHEIVCHATRQYMLREYSALQRPVYGRHLVLYTLERGEWL